MNILSKLKTLSFAQCVLYISLFFVGIFHVYLSCILSVALLVWLGLRLLKKGKIDVQVDMTLISMSVLVIGYLITPIWAVDSGTAVFGFFKFLPVLLYTVVLMQEENGREKVINGLPYVITVMTVLSVVGMYIPIISAYFTVSERLGGFLQYPNSFAIILLTAELLLITKEKPLVLDYLCISVLLFGILYTGSRTVFILAGASNVVAMFLNKSKKVRLILLGCIGSGIVLVLLYCAIIGELGVLSRLLKISLNQSTFIGRLLYAQDALPTILKNPFGIGYMGYYFIQQSIQSGVYGIMFIHNDLLQILLDVGWIPCLVFVTAIVMSLANKNTPLRYKLILVTIVLHSLFDFDLQYIAVFMMTLLFMTPKVHKTVTLKKGAALYGAQAVLIGLCLYFGTVQGLSRFDAHEAALKLYSLNTESSIELIKDASTTEAEELADHILKNNSYVAITYSVKARAAYEKGDFGKVIQYKNKAIKAAPFSYAEYWEYGRMLVNGIKLYEQAGDLKSAEVCKKELLALSKALPALEKRMSKYAKQISQQPVLYFPKDIREALEALEGGGGN